MSIPLCCSLLLGRAGWLLSFPPLWAGLSCLSCCPSVCATHTAGPEQPPMLHLCPCLQGQNEPDRASGAPVMQKYEFILLLTTDGECCSNKLACLQQLRAERSVLCCVLQGAFKVFYKTVHKLLMHCFDGLVNLITTHLVISKAKV